MVTPNDLNIVPVLTPTCIRFFVAGLGCLLCLTFGWEIPTTPSEFFNIIAVKSIFIIGISPQLATY